MLPLAIKFFTAYQTRVRDLGFDLDLGVHLRALIAVITGQSKFLTVGNLSRERLEAGWGRTQRVFDFAVDFALKNLHINSRALLSSPLLLITTAYWADQRDLKIDPDEADAFRSWFLIASAKGRYSRGSSESVLDQDLAVLRNGGGATELLQRLEQQFGRLEFLPTDLVGRNTQSGVFKAMFLLFKENGADDWATSLRISPKHANSADKIEFHHIFPKAQLYKQNFRRAEVNALANFCFLTKDTNLKILDRLPEEYLEKVESAHPGALASQWIPSDRSLWRIDRFRDFLEARKELLAAEMNRRMEELLHGDTKWLAGPAAPALSPIAVPGGITSEDEEQQQKK